MPSASNQHYDNVLSTITVKYDNADFFAEKIFKPRFVEKESDLYPVYDKEYFRAQNDFWQDGDEANEVEWGWNLQRYVCEGHALRDLITNRQRQNSDLTTLDVDTTEHLTQQLLLNADIAAAAILSSTTATNNAGNANASWVNYATASPKTDIMTAKNAIFTATGKTANTMLVPATVANRMTLIDEIKEERKYVNDLTQSGLPRNLWGLNVIEAMSLKNTANPGQAVSLTQTFNDTVWIGYVDPSGPGYKKLTYGALFYSQPRQARRYRWEPKNGEYIEVNWVYGFKVISAACGYVLTSVFDGT